MNCPKCGAAIEEGKAYCSNPACGALTGPAAAQAPRRVTIEKKLYFTVKLDFVKLARLAAAAILLLAGAYLYFFGKR